MKKEELKDAINNFRLEQNNPDLDWDRIGDSIMTGLEKKDKRKKRVLWIFLSLFLFIGCWTALYFNPFTEKMQHSDVSPSEATSPSSGESFGHINTTVPEGNRDQEKIEKEEQLSSTASDELNVLNIEHEIISGPSGANTKNSTKQNQETLKQSNLISVQHDALVAGDAEEFITAVSETTSIEEVKEMISTEEARTNIALYPLPIKNLRIALISTDFRTPEIGSLEEQEEISTNKRWFTSLYGGFLLSNISDQYVFSSYDYGCTSGINLGYEFGEHWNISSGVSMNVFHFTSSFVAIDTVPFYQPGTIDTIITDGNSVTTITTDTVQAQRIRSFRHANRVRILSVPFAVGYSFGTNKFRINPSAGVIVNMWSRLSGRTTDEQFVISDRDESFYSSVQIGWQLGLQTYYALDKNWAINSGITYQNMPRINETAGRIQQLGLTVGVTRYW